MARGPSFSSRLLPLVAGTFLAGILLYDLQVIVHLAMDRAGYILDLDFQPAGYPVGAAFHGLLAFLLLPWIGWRTRQAAPTFTTRTAHALASALAVGGAIGGVVLVNARILQDVSPFSPVSLAADILVVLVALGTTRGLRRPKGSMAAGLWALVAVLAPTWSLFLLGPQSSTPARSSAEAGPDILVLTVDTLRRDRLGCYGSELGATPTMDSLAVSGVLFEDAWSQIPITLPAHTTLMTGVHPATHGIHNNGTYRLGEGLPTLAELCRDAGYATGAFISATPLEARYGLNRGFDIYEDDLRRVTKRTPRGRLLAVGTSRSLVLRALSERFLGQRPGLAEIDGEVTVSRAAEWFERTPGPRLAWVHLFDPHVPLDPPADLRSGFPAPEADHAHLQARVDAGVLRGQNMTLLSSPFDPDLYNAEVAATDRAVARLLASWRDTGEGRPQVTLLIADHGEHLGEHDYFGHTALLFEPSLRIPFVASGVGIPEGRRIAAVAQQVDFLPTLGEWAGLSVGSHVEGRSLVPFVRGDAPAGAPEPPVFVETHAPGGTRLAGVIRDGWKWIRRIDGPDAIPGSEGLFELATDPVEGIDRRADSASRMVQLDAILDETLEVMTQKGGAGEALATDAETRRRLESLGYVQ